MVFLQKLVMNDSNFPNKKATRIFLPVAWNASQNKNGHGLFCTVTAEVSLLQGVLGVSKTSWVTGTTDIITATSEGGGRGEIPVAINDDG